MAGEATVMREADGADVVTQADERILVHDSLLRDVEAGRLGSAVYALNVLSFGTAGRGLGRVFYTWRAFDPLIGVHHFDRMPA